MTKSLLGLLAPSPMVRHRLEKQERSRAVQVFMCEIAADDAVEPQDPCRV